MKSKERLLKRVISRNIFPTLWHLHGTYWRWSEGSLVIVIWFGCCQNIEQFKMIVSGLESKDANIFMFWRGNLWMEIWSNTGVRRFPRKKIISVFTSKTHFPRFNLLLVLYYFCSLLSFSGGMSLAFLVDRRDYLISSSILCVPGKFWIDFGHDGPQGIKFQNGGTHWTCFPYAMAFVLFKQRTGVMQYFKNVIFVIKDWCFTAKNLNMIFLNTGNELYRFS